MKPRAIIPMRAGAYKSGNRFSVAARAAVDFACPSARKTEIKLRNKKMKAVALFVRENHVVVTVFIHIDKTQTIVFARGVHNRNTFRQTEIHRAPAAQSAVPLKYFVFGFIGNNDFTDAVAIDIAKPA